MIGHVARRRRRAARCRPCRAGARRTARPAGMRQPSARCRRAATAVVVAAARRARPADDRHHGGDGRGPRPHRRRPDRAPWRRRIASRRASARSWLCVRAASLVAVAGAEVGGQRAHASGSRTSRRATPCGRAPRRAGCWPAPSSASWRRGRTGWSPRRRRRARGCPARSSAIVSSRSFSGGDDRLGALDAAAVGRRQRVAVDLAVRRPRQGVEQHERRRHHVVGQRRAQVGPQLGRQRLGVPPRRLVGVAPTTAGAASTRRRRAAARAPSASAARGRSGRGPPPTTSPRRRSGRRSRRGRRGGSPAGTAARARADVGDRARRVGARRPAAAPARPRGPAGRCAAR